LTDFCIIVILLPLMALAIEQRKKWELRVITKGVKIKWGRESIFNGNEQFSFFLYFRVEFVSWF